MRNKELISYFPLILLVCIVLSLSLHMHWQGDAVAFSFFIPAENEDFSFIPLKNIWDIWPSMCNHWHNSTGRFFSHSIVQLFCAFIGKTGFAICNAAIWAILVLFILRMVKLKSPSFHMTALTSMLLLVVFSPLSDFREQSFPFEPPHQINYVWMGLWNMVWISVFLCNNSEKSGILKFFLLAVFSFLGGQSNEAFSVPIGGAILIYAVYHRFNLSRHQYLMAICYGIGTFLVILAPGNFQRMGHGVSLSVLHAAAGLLPGLLLPAVWALSVWIRRGQTRGSFRLKSDYKLFFATAIIINYLLGMVLGMGSGIRMLTCANLLLIVLILINLHDIKFNRIFTTAIVLGMTLIGVWRYVSISKLNEKNVLIERLYHESADGVVVLPDDLFLYQVREFIVRPHPYMMLERSVNPSKPNIAIRPRSMMDLNLAVDTNLLLPLSDQAWLMIQSRKNPADFIIEKTVLPDMLNFPMSPRRMDWSDENAVFDSTGLWRSAIYINERPYLKSKVKMYESE